MTPEFIDRQPFSAIEQRMGRRRFIAGGVASLSAMVLGCGSHQQAEPSCANDDWIDAHVHVWTEPTERFPVAAWVKPGEMSPRHFSAEEWLNLGKQAGVRRAVLVQHSPYFGNDSSYLVDCRRRYLGTFSIIGRIDEHEPNLEARVRLLKSQGIRGLRISPTIHGDRTPVPDPPNWLKSAGMRRLWKAAADEQIAMCPILTPEFLPTLLPMCAEFPQTRCVIDHLGQVDIHAEVQVESLLRLSKSPNVFVKVSAFYKFGNRTPPHLDLAPVVRRLVGEYGSSRLMWGSDCPYQLQAGGSLADSVNLVAQNLPFLSPTDRRSLLRDVADRVFF